MFSYYGSKKKIIKYYPQPEHDLIIEPFAGAAWYSLEYKDRDIILNEKNPTVYGIWNWLINEASKEELLEYKNFYLGDDISDLPISQPHKDFLGFCLNRGSSVPKSTVTKWSCQSKIDPLWASTVAFQVERASSLIDDIRHWKVLYGDYSEIEIQEATWFVDPPYQHGGHHYPTSNINYDELNSWIKELKGQKIVCENNKADWANFQPLISYYGQNKSSNECIYKGE